MSAEEIKKSMEKLQLEANRLCAHSGYQHSLVRYHQSLAEDFDNQIDVIAKKIRNLEENSPKDNVVPIKPEEKQNEPVEEIINH